MTQNRPKIAIVYFPWAAESIYNFIQEIVNIIDPLSSSIVIIGGNKYNFKNSFNNNKINLINTYLKMHNTSEIQPLILSKIIWGLKAILVQILNSFAILRYSKDIDIVLFYMAYPHFLLPLFTSKFLGKKTVEVVTRQKNAEKKNINRFLSYQDPIIYNIIDGVSPESKSLLPHLKLDETKIKILSDGHRYIDTNIFHCKKKYENRNKIGFISRLEKSKGIMNLLKAIAILNEENIEIEFIIGGDGNLKNDVLNEIEIMKNNNINIRYIGWISKEEMPFWLNEFKILILPTEEDAFPTIILESMACGTLVLTTKIGALPDIIEDGITGFFMDNTNPEVIAENIKRVLNHSNIENIIKSSKILIDSNYSYNVVVDNWKNIIQELIYES